jgi:hypothetical protein
MLKSRRTSLAQNASWLTVLGLFTVISVAKAVTVTSPDGLVTATLAAPGGNLTYSVSYRGATVVENSSLGLTVNGTYVGAGVTLNPGSVYAANETFASRHGMRAVATHHYQAQNGLVGHARREH